jgi:putative transposase
VGGLFYHVLNRATDNVSLFRKDGDYAAFERVMREGCKHISMRVVSYCLMPNHWHLLLWTRKDGDLSRYMAWVTTTHAERWHEFRKKVGRGHLYQGRYKSSIIQDDRHFLAVARYIERNALRASMVLKAEDWRWTSLWRRTYGRPFKGLYSVWPVPRPDDWSDFVNKSQSGEEENKLRTSITRGQPYGGDAWKTSMAAKYRLQSTLHMRGRPRKGV